MLIINADDLGTSHTATDNAMTCHNRRLITSASAMVFMLDSQRAADLAEEADLATGLHLNLTRKFTSQQIPERLREYHFSTVTYFGISKWSQVIYNPFIKNKVEYSFKAQFDEYCRLFRREPEKIDGHHHVHLCMNMILDRILPPGSRVRRNFSFAPGEKGAINRFYRKVIDNWLLRHYSSTDYFFSLESALDLQRLDDIASMARSADVELAVHPENRATFDFLMSHQYQALIADIPRGSYRFLSRSK